MKARRLVRIVISILFILSGFFKAVDPKGFSFKLTEYFSATIFNVPFLQKLALPIAIIVIGLEFLLGMALLLKIRLLRTLYVLFFLSLGLAFLNLSSAYFHFVDDCGCFGDAFKLSPWTAFAGDAILAVLVLILFRIYRKDEGKSNKFRQSDFVTLIAFFLSCVVLVIFMVGGLVAEPLIDFRDYKIGTNLKEVRAKLELNPSIYETEYQIRNEKTHKEVTILQNHYISSGIWMNSDWKIIKGKTRNKLIKKGFESEVTNFKIINSDGTDVTQKILDSKHIFMVFTYRPERLKKQRIEELENGMLKMKSQVYAVSTRSNTFSKVPHGVMSGDAIKTIARSNPFILILENGKIVFKEEARDFFNK